MRYLTMIAAIVLLETTNHLSMKTILTYTEIVLLLSAAAILTATSGRADTYSWTNF